MTMDYTVGKVEQLTTKPCYDEVANGLVGNYAQALSSGNVTSYWPSGKVVFQSDGQEVMRIGLSAVTARGVDLSSSQNTPQQPKGLKFDDTKTRWSLFDFPFLESVAATLNYGRLKYTQTLTDGTVQDGAANWKLVDNKRERYFNAAMRHLVAWFNGEKTDPESGQHHLAHATCCIMFLFWSDTNEN